MSPTTTVPAVDKAMERRLASVAKRAEDYRTERDALIVMAFLDGAGIREIARAVNMTHPAVKYIVEKNAENPAIVEEQKRRDEYRRTSRADRRDIEDRYRRVQDRKAGTSTPLPPEDDL